MPNWCNNHLTIEAEPHVITALLAKAKGKPTVPSDEVVPFSYVPFVQDKLDAFENFEAQWYEFMMANVGCKWFPEIEPEQVMTESCCVSVYFDSPWSPPFEGTKAIAEWLRAQGFSFQLTLAYEESGNSFCGLYTANRLGQVEQNGEYVELDAEELRTGSEEDYAGVCQSFGLSFADLQARAADDVEYVTLCPDFFLPHAK